MPLGAPEGRMSRSDIDDTWQVQILSHVELGDGRVDLVLVELPHDGDRVGVATRLRLSRDVDGDLVNALNLAAETTP